MHCRPSYPINDSVCSSAFLFTHSDFTNNLSNRTCSSLFFDDQIPPIPKPRRRLEDPVIKYSSNYYATYPNEQSQVGNSPPTAAPRRIYQQLENKGVYCDLFNLLERPPSVKPRKKYRLNENTIRLHHRSIDYENIHAKVKDINEKKHHHHQSKISCYKEKDDRILSMPSFNKFQTKDKTNNCLYQRYSPSKGFFRRVVRNYFCMPMTISNRDLSN